DAAPSAIEAMHSAHTTGIGSTSTAHGTAAVLKNQIRKNAAPCTAIPARDAGARRAVGSSVFTFFGNMKGTKNAAQHTHMKMRVPITMVLGAITVLLSLSPSPALEPASARPRCAALAVHPPQSTARRASLAGEFVRPMRSLCG